MRWWIYQLMNEFCSVDTWQYIRVLSLLSRKQALICFSNVYYQVEILKGRAMSSPSSFPSIDLPLGTVRKQALCYLLILRFCYLFLVKQFLSVKSLYFRGKPFHWLFLTNHPFYLPSCHLWELSCDAASGEPSPGLISSQQITESWRVFCLWLNVSSGFTESEIRR